ncbi:hypothetical protein BJ322DRAFT_1076920 [Thelephora terrestris]|uniref:AN1-type domain-containing protein n=1 Tax=Thelephora terrestris TaxID=56493 RepID=A0A9P6H852_9AGAM|nr:hypothetical protein BJ322DRAFT_1076920 [Thelephora terrestris]
MTATPGPSTGLLAVGHQCSAQYCSLVDYLPFKCQHCEQKFCDEHRLPASHNCAKYDELKHDRVTPACPLCNTPVTIPIGRDPNIRMESHIANECSVMTGKTKKSTQPHCANLRCKKLLFAPIRCDNCSQQFCPQHRFPSDHRCKTAEAQTSSKPTTTITYTVNTKAQGHANEVSAKRNAAMAAIKRSMVSTNSLKADTSSSALRPAQMSSPSTTSSSKKSPNSLPNIDRSPSPPSGNSPPTPVPLSKPTPSTCAEDVADETRLMSSGPRLYAPPSLFASA